MEINLGKYYYNTFDKIGVGGFGNVYKGKRIETLETLAIKVLNIELLNQNLKFYFFFKECRFKMRYK